MNDTIEWQFFNPHDPLTIIDRKLPHWSQAGVMSFITWRTNDSMPKAVVQKWHEERRQWLQQHLLLNNSTDYESQVPLLPIAIQHRFRDFSSTRWHGHLDDCHGACVLRQPAIAKIVSDSLHHFDDKHYLLTDYVIMPNHVHLLVAFPDEEAMLKQCDSWKHYTATRSIDC